MEKLKELIDTCIEDPRYAESRHSVKAETWAYAGEGAQRAAAYLISKHEELLRAEEGK